MLWLYPLVIQMTRSNPSGLHPVGLPQGKGVYRKALHLYAAILLDVLSSNVWVERDRESLGMFCSWW